MPARRPEPLARDLPAELQVAATNGSMVTDSRGRKHVDFVMGWCVGTSGGAARRSRNVLMAARLVAFPHPLECLRHGLHHHAAVDMTGRF